MPSALVTEKLSVAAARPAARRCPGQIAVEPVGHEPSSTSEKVPAPPPRSRRTDLAGTGRKPALRCGSAGPRSPPRSGRPTTPRPPGHRDRAPPCRRQTGHREAVGRRCPAVSASVSGSALSPVDGTVLARRFVGRFVANYRLGTGSRTVSGPWRRGLRPRLGRRDPVRSPPIDAAVVDRPTTRRLSA